MKLSDWSDDKKRDYTKLNSVGSVFDPLTTNVFALHSDRSIDFQSGIPIEEVDEEWIQKLSDEDCDKIIAHKYMILETAIGWKIYSK